MNIDIEIELKNEFESWLMPHIEEVLGTGSFLTAKTFRRDSPDDGYAGYTIQYKARNDKSLEEYLTNRAPGLRRDSENRFGKHFKVFRRVLKEF